MHQSFVTAAPARPGNSGDIYFSLCKPALRAGIFLWSKPAQIPACKCEITSTGLGIPWFHGTAVTIYGTLVPITGPVQRLLHYNASHIDDMNIHEHRRSSKVIKLCYKQCHSEIYNLTVNLLVLTNFNKIHKYICTLNSFDTTLKSRLPKKASILRALKAFSPDE